MKKASTIIMAIFLSVSLAACASKDITRKGEKDAKKSVNCGTAEGDIRVLQGEKTHASEQLAAGVSAIVPVGLVVGVATGSEGTNTQVATGNYNAMLDKKIAEIKQKCGVK